MQTEVEAEAEIVEDKGDEKEAQENVEVQDEEKDLEEEKKVQEEEEENEDEENRTKQMNDKNKVRQLLSLTVKMLASFIFLLIAY